MARILIIGSEPLTNRWTPLLRRAGHQVEFSQDTLSFQDRFSGDAVDVLIVEITNADHGEAMLMIQARTVWPGCRVVAVPRNRSYRSSALFGMGLWKPDRLLMHPVADDLLLESVQQLWIQTQAEQRIARPAPSRSAAEKSSQNVVLHCDQMVESLWSIRPL